MLNRNQGRPVRREQRCALPNRTGEHLVHRPAKAEASRNTGLAQNGPLWIQNSIKSLRQQVSFGSTHRPLPRSQSSCVEPTQKHHRLPKIAISKDRQEKITKKQFQTPRPAQDQGIFREGGFFGAQRQRRPAGEGGHSYRARRDHAKIQKAASRERQPLYEENIQHLQQELYRMDPADQTRNAATQSTFHKCMTETTKGQIREFRSNSEMVATGQRRPHDLQASQPSFTQNYQSKRSERSEGSHSSRASLRPSEIDMAPVRAVGQLTERKQRLISANQRAPGGGQEKPKQIVLKKNLNRSRVCSVDYAGALANQLPRIVGPTSPPKSEYPSCQQREANPSRPERDSQPQYEQATPCFDKFECEHNTTNEQAKREASRVPNFPDAIEERSAQNVLGDEDYLEASVQPPCGTPSGLAVLMTQNQVHDRKSGPNGMSFSFHKSQPAHKYDSAAFPMLNGARQRPTTHDQMKETADFAKHQRAQSNPLYLNDFSSKIGSGIVKQNQRYDCQGSKSDDNESPIKRLSMKIDQNRLKRNSQLVLNPEEMPSGSITPNIYSGLKRSQTTDIQEFRRSFGQMLEVVRQSQESQRRKQQRRKRGQRASNNQKPSQVPPAFVDSSDPAPATADPGQAQKLQAIRAEMNRLMQLEQEILAQAGPDAPH